MGMVPNARILLLTAKNDSDWKNSMSLAVESTRETSYFLIKPPSNCFLNFVDLFLVYFKDETKLACI